MSIQRSKLPSVWSSSKMQKVTCARPSVSEGSCGPDAQLGQLVHSEREREASSLIEHRVG